MSPLLSSCPLMCRCHVLYKASNVTHGPAITTLPGRLLMPYYSHFRDDRTDNQKSDIAQGYTSGVSFLRL